MNKDFIVPTIRGYSPSKKGDKKRKKSTERKDEKLLD